LIDCVECCKRLAKPELVYFVRAVASDSSKLLNLLRKAKPDLSERCSLGSVKRLSDTTIQHVAYPNI